jgi:hypothetical protein
MPRGESSCPLARHIPDRTYQGRGPPCATLKLLKRNGNKHRVACNASRCVVIAETFLSPVGGLDLFGLHCKRVRQAGCTEISYSYSRRGTNCTRSGGQIGARKQERTAPFSALAQQLPNPIGADLGSLAFHDRQKSRTLGTSQVTQDHR